MSTTRCMSTGTEETELIIDRYILGLEVTDTQWARKLQKMNGKV